MSDFKTPNCINCGSHEVRYDSAFGFYKCESCSTVWAKDEDDPDYDEAVSCPDCWGTGLIYAWVNDSQPSKCTTSWALDTCSLMSRTDKSGET